MTRYIGSVLLLILFLQTGCQKYNRLDDLQELRDTCRISARMFLYDTLTKQGQYSPQPKKRITIIPATQADTLNYLYSATTDDNGYFQFKNLTRGKAYRLIYEETVAGTLFRGDTIVTAPVPQLPFVVSPSLDRQTGIYYRIVDANHQTIPGASVCIFSNAQAYQSGKCEGSNFSQTTDAYGRYFLTGLPVGTYYTLVTATVGGVKYTVKDTFDISTSVIRKTRQVVKPQAETSIEYTVRDPQGYVAKGAQVCLFLNPLSAQAGGCDGSLYTDSTNASGKVTFSGIEADTYYVNASLKIGVQTYTATDVLMITVNTKQQLSLNLH